MNGIDWITWALIAANMLFNVRVLITHRRRSEVMRDVRDECAHISELVMECDKVLAMYDDFNARRLRQKIEETRQRLISKGRGDQEPGSERPAA